MSRSGLDYVRPIWDDMKIALVCASSNEYVPYLCVYLKSIAENCRSRKDVIIFNRNISIESKEIIFRYFLRDDMSIRFFDPTSFFKEIDLYVPNTLKYLSMERYFSIISPVILREYSKIIFTDIDLIVLDDIIAHANELDMKGHPIAACIEPIWVDMCKKHYKYRIYSKDTLKISDPSLYYNTGVVIFDVYRYNKLDSSNKLLEIINNNKLIFLDQDAFNIFFKDNFYTLSSDWNYGLSYNGPKFNGIYGDGELDAKVFHYPGPFKPWTAVLKYKSDIWWSYARQTPYYEEILSRLIQSRISDFADAHVTPLKKQIQDIKSRNLPVGNNQDSSTLSLSLNKLFKEIAKRAISFAYSIASKNRCVFEFMKKILHLVLPASSYARISNYLHSQRDKK